MKDEELHNLDDKEIENALKTLSARNQADLLVIRESLGPERNIETNYFSFEPESSVAMLREFIIKDSKGSSLVDGFDFDKFYLKSELATKYFNS